MSVTAKTVDLFKGDSYVGYDARRDVLVQKPLAPEYLAYDMVHDGVMDNYPRPIAPDQWPAVGGGEECAPAEAKASSGRR